MKKVVITINNFDNEAMAVAPDQAVYDILMNLAEHVGDGCARSMPEKIRDANGNVVGSVVVK